MSIVEAVLIGIFIGILSGVVGVGGGVVLVPILLYGYGMSQSKAQGTSLAMLLAPSGLLAFWHYYKAGHADLRLGLWIALGVFLGGWVGGDLAQRFSSLTLRRIFASFLIVVAAKLFFSK